MIVELILFALGGVAGSLIAYIVFRPDLKRISKKNYLIEQENIALEEENNKLEYHNNNLLKTKDKLTKAILNLKEQEITLQNSIGTIKQQAQEAGDELFKTNFELAKEKLSHKEQELKEAYKKYEQECKKEYLQVCEDSSKEYRNQIDILKNEIDELRQEIENQEQLLTEKKAAIHAIIESYKLQESEEKQKNFYKIVLSNSAKEEIEKIKEILPYLADPEPLNKVIWKVYYEKPTSDLIGRVIGEGVKSGIYKITDIISGKCYIGQSVNLADRWRQHIKRGLGAEPPTKNKLYPAMQEIGLENFTFEIIEECPKDKLDEREDYWQEIFEAKSWGYSIK